MSASDKHSLEQRLAELLSISIDDDRDYVIDVLDSLVEIGDPNDVAEYLSSFVAGGGDNDDGGNVDLQQFAGDVKKFSMGEALSSAASNENKKSTSAIAIETKPKTKILDEAAAERERIKRREVEARERQRQEQLLSKRKKEEEEEERRKEAAAEKRRQNEWAKKTASRERKAKESSSKKNQPVGNVKQNQSKSKGIITHQSAKMITAAKGQPAKEQPCRPEKGTPTGKYCGCYGNRHEPLTNCLRCGRISCAVEGTNDYCHHCGYFISDPSSYMRTGVAKNDSALRHKERLLEFDKTSAARTHIHDDQEDYFVASTSMWATREEQDDAAAMEEERQQKLQRQKQTLKIQF